MAQAQCLADAHAGLVQQRDEKLIPSPLTRSNELSHLLSGEGFGHALWRSELDEPGADRLTFGDVVQHAFVAPAGL